MTDESEQPRRAEAEARDRLRDAETEAGETLEAAEELEESVAEPEAVAEEEGLREPGQRGGED